MWGHSWGAIALPILATIGGTVCAIISIVGQVLVAETKTPGSLPQHFLRFSEPYFALSFSTGVITTGMIVFRIWQVQNFSSKVGLDGKDPWRRTWGDIIEILVESAALNSASLLITFALFVRGTVDLDYMQSIQSQVSGLAPTLIFLRLAQGSGRPQTEWTMETSLNFGPRSQSSVSTGIPREEVSEGDLERGEPMGLKVSNVHFDKSSTAIGSVRTDSERTTSVSASNVGYNS